MAAEPRPITPIGILAATLERARARLAAVPSADPELGALLDRAAAMAAGLEPYLERCSTPESAALAGIAARTAAIGWEGAAGATGTGALEQEMLSGRLEGRFLAMLVRLTGARRVLDIGTFTGYSALAMAEALPADGRLIASELDPAVAALAQQGFDDSAAGARIELRVGPAMQMLAAAGSRGESFDLVFLDADKAGYGGYVEALLATSLLAPAGLLCVDNTLLSAEAYLPGPASPNGAAVAAFNEALAADPRVEQVLVPLRDGITLIRRTGAAPRRSGADDGRA